MLALSLRHATGVKPPSWLPQATVKFRAVERSVHRASFFESRGLVGGSLERIDLGKMNLQLIANKKNQDRA
jgi:hypothetical protein